MADITPIVPLTGELAMPEKVWMQGPPGPQGQQGEPGAAATVTVGTVTTGEPGTDAIVTNSGTENAAVLNFTIPRGATGAAGAVGPRGPKGDTGETGPAGAGVPDGGTVGQLLGKTESGTAWIDPPQSGVQSDWNQNDATQPDYVKNRPFYTKPTETVLAEESAVSFANAGGYYAAEFPTSFNAEFGKTYKVSWDGTVYECICEGFNGRIPIIGNKSIIGFGSDTGEPFVIFNESGPNETGWASMTTDTSSSHTLSISVLVTEVVKVDEKYLPTIPADKLPTIPVIKFTIKIATNIANDTQPSFTVSNLSYSEIYAIVEKGIFQIEDSDSIRYRPIKHWIDSSGNIHVAIIDISVSATYAVLTCAAGQARFYRDAWWQLEATQK